MFCTTEWINYSVECLIISHFGGMVESCLLETGVRLPPGADRGVGVRGGRLQNSTWGKEIASGFICMMF